MQSSVVSQLAADLPDLTACADQLNQQPVDVTEYQPTDFRFTESTYQKYLPDDRMNLIGRIDVGAAGNSNTLRRNMKVHLFADSLMVHWCVRCSTSLFTYQQAMLFWKQKDAGTHVKYYHRGPQVSQHLFLQVMPCYSGSVVQY